MRSEEVYSSRFRSLYPWKLGHFYRRNPHRYVLYFCELKMLQGGIDTAKNLLYLCSENSKIRIKTQHYKPKNLKNYEYFKH